jgi:hypothetical protein
VYKTLKRVHFQQLLLLRSIGLEEMPTFNCPRPPSGTSEKLIFEFRLDTLNSGRFRSVVTDRKFSRFLAKFFGKSQVETEKNLTTIGAGTVGRNETSNEYKKSSEQYKLERKWREWVDTKFIHTLSPNVYCTLRQSLNTFRWFSQAGDWEEIFPWYQRWIIVYVGVVVMRVVAERLKKKHKLNSDVRISLYECANEWVKAVGKKDFLGKKKS